MGLGDEIMASGRALELSNVNGGDKVRICDRRMRPRCHPIWKGLPWIDPNAELMIMDAPGCRPYIVCVEDSTMIFDMDHRPTAGRIFIDPESMNFARSTWSAWLEGTTGKRPKVIIQPHIKRTVSARNKDWGFEKWQRLVPLLLDQGAIVMQCNYDGPVISGCRVLTSDDFLGVAAMMSEADLVITTDGGYHHAAAACGIDAVVIWGGFSSPEVLGYDEHCNVYDDVPENPCGKLRDCEHCRSAMDRITVDRVFHAAMRRLVKRRKI